MQQKHKTLLLATVTSIITTTLTCSLFVCASAITINKNNAAMPFKVTVGNKSYPANSPSSRTGIYTEINGSDRGSGGDSCWEYFDNNTGYACSYYNKGSAVKGSGILTGRGETTLGGTRFIAHDYAATCPDGQYMTGYNWGTVWGNRYALQPECATATVIHN